jgi:hypothetical protein
MGCGWGLFIRTQVRNFALLYASHIPQSPFLCSASLGKVRTAYPCLVTRRMLMEWKFTVVYRPKNNKKLRFITSHICSARRHVFNMIDENTRD